MTLGVEHTDGSTGGPDQHGPDLAKFIDAWSGIPETARQLVRELLSGLQMPEDALGLVKAASCADPAAAKGAHKTFGESP